MSEKSFKRYDVATDKFVPVTQEWIDGAQKALNRFAILRAEIRKIVSIPLVDENGVLRE